MRQATQYPIEGDCEQGAPTYRNRPASWPERVVSRQYGAIDFANAQGWTGPTLSPGACERAHAEILSIDAMCEVDRTHWARLSERADTENVFALDWFMQSALAHCANPRAVRLAVVRTRGGEWIGVLPLHQRGWIGRAPIPSWHSWQANNQFLGSPLVAKGHEEEFWQALLAHLDVRPGPAIALYCGVLAEDSRTARALVNMCGLESRDSYLARLFERSAVLPASAAPPSGTTTRKQLVRLASLERKLEREHGPARINTVAEGRCPITWIEDFLTLERSGWKGRSGSALACNGSTDALFREVIERGHERGSVRLATLQVGGTILAMSSWFTTGAHSYGFKMAYNEAFRRYAPGRLLMRNISQRVASDAHRLFDSCAPESAKPDTLWPDKRRIADYVVAIGSSKRRRLLSTGMNALSAYRNIKLRCAQGISN